MLAIINRCCIREKMDFQSQIWMWVKVWWRLLQCSVSQSLACTVAFKERM
jgi:hypothetical protein